jgi:hypothetical protein
MTIIRGIQVQHHRKRLLVEAVYVTLLMDFHGASMIAQQRLFREGLAKSATVRISVFLYHEQIIALNG